MTHVEHPARSTRPSKLLSPTGIALSVVSGAASAANFGFCLYVAIGHVTVFDEHGEPAAGTWAIVITTLLFVVFAALALSVTWSVTICTDRVVVRRALWASRIELRRIRRIAIDSRTQPHSLVIETPRRTYWVFPPLTREETLIRELEELTGRRVER